MPAKMYANLTATTAKDGKGIRFPHDLKHKIIVYCANNDLSKRALDPVKIMNLMIHLDWNPNNDIELFEILAKALTNFVRNNVHGGNPKLKGALVEHTTTPGRQSAMYTVIWRAYTRNWPKDFTPGIVYTPPQGTDLEQFRSEGVRLSTPSVESVVAAVVEMKEAEEEEEEEEEEEDEEDESGCKRETVREVAKYVEVPKIVEVEKIVEKIVEVEVPGNTSTPEQQQQVESFVTAFAAEFARNGYFTSESAMAYMRQSADAPSTLAQLVIDGLAAKEQTAELQREVERLQQKIAEMDRVALEVQGKMDEEVAVLEMKLVEAEKDHCCEVQRLKEQMSAAAAASGQAELEYRREVEGLKKDLSKKTAAAEPNVKQEATAAAVAAIIGSYPTSDFQQPAELFAPQPQRPTSSHSTLPTSPSPIANTMSTEQLAKLANIVRGFPSRPTSAQRHQQSLARLDEIVHGYEARQQEAVSSRPSLQVQEFVDIVGHYPDSAAEEAAPKGKGRGNVMTTWKARGKKSLAPRAGAATGDVGAAGGAGGRYSTRSKGSEALFARREDLPM